MNKLFVFQKNSESDYIKELECGYKLSFIEKNVYKIEIDKLNIDFLKEHKIQVVIANSLPLQWFYITKGLKIVTIILDKLENNIELADIVIDFKSKDSTKYFTGVEYSICKNSNNKIIFREIINLVNKLIWDSNFFGFNVSYISCKYLTENVIYHVNRFVNRENIKLIEYLCNCHDSKSVTLAEKNQFHFTDIRLTFEKKLFKPYIVNLDYGFTVGLAKRNHIQELKGISKDIYTDSRYYFDGNFDIEKVRVFYQSWVEKAILGTFDNECYAIFKGDKPVGFCTIRYYPSKTAQIGLFGISGEYRGNGLAMKLIKTVLNVLYDKSINNVYVVTQGRNYPAQRIYQKAGFLTKSTELWYHKWI